MLRDLGLEGQIVGVGQIDPAAPSRAAIVGDFRQLDYEKLLSIRPTDILLQDTAKEPTSDRLLELARKHGWKITRIKLENVAGILLGLRQLGEALGLQAQAEKLAGDIELRLAALKKRTADRPHPRVLLVVSASPQWLAAAGGTFLDEVLRAAGGVNALSDSAVLYPELDAEAVVALKPEVVVHIPYNQNRSPLVLPSGLEAKVLVLEDPLALLPSSSMPGVAEKLARLLHGPAEPLNNNDHQGTQDTKKILKPQINTDQHR